MKELPDKKYPSIQLALQSPVHSSIESAIVSILSAGTVSAPRQLGCFIPDLVLTLLVILDLCLCRKWVSRLAISGRPVALS